MIEKLIKYDLTTDKGETIQVGILPYAEMVGMITDLTILKATVNDLERFVKENTNGKLSEKDEYEWILKNIQTEKELYNTYLKIRTDRRGYAITDIAKFSQISVSIYKENGKIDTKKNIVKRIFEKIK